MPVDLTKTPVCTLLFTTLLLSACGQFTAKNKSSQNIENLLNTEDPQLADYATRIALETLKKGQMQQWNNPKTGHYGEVSIKETWYDKTSQQYCRLYQETIYINAQSQNFEDAACRNKRGAWVAKR